VKLLGWLEISANAPLSPPAETRRFNLCKIYSRATWFSFPADIWVCLFQSKSCPKLPSIHSLRPSQIDFLAGRPLIHTAGRVTQVKAVLSSIPIYHQIALHCPKWVIKEIVKILRGFLWKERKDIKGGHCLVGWQRVCRAQELGVLAFTIWR
jgi:hypothetical protein